MAATYRFSLKKLTNEQVLESCGNYIQQNISTDDVSEVQDIIVVHKQVVESLLI